MRLFFATLIKLLRKYIIKKEVIKLAENKDSCDCGCIPLKEGKKESCACGCMPLKVAETKDNCGCGCVPLKKESQQEK